MSTLNSCQSTNNLHINYKIQERLPTLIYDYELLWTIGSGFYGTVVKAEKRTQIGKKSYAIKILGPGSSSEEIRNEIRYLQLLKGCTNIVQYVNHHGNGIYMAIVTEYFKSDSFVNNYRTFTPKFVQCYMYNLLISLEQLHSKGITHGDVKPENFLFNLDTKEFRLIDLGMATSINAPLFDKGTIGFISPESIVKYHSSTTAIDIWSAGVIFMLLLSGVDKIFSSDGREILKEFCVIFGTHELRKAMNLLHKNKIFERTVSSFENRKPLNLRKICIFFRQYRNLNALAFSEVNCPFCEQLQIFCLCEDANEESDILDQMCDLFPGSTYALLTEMLKVSPLQRINIRKALGHPFFHERLSANRHHCESPTPLQLKRGIATALISRLKKEIISKNL